MGLSVDLNHNSDRWNNGDKGNDNNKENRVDFGSKNKDEEFRFSDENDIDEWK